MSDASPPRAAWDLPDRLVLAAVEARVLGEVRHPVRLGRYEIERSLGVGGMGRLLLAHDPELQRRVAIKLVAPHLADVPQTVKDALEIVPISTVDEAISRALTGKLTPIEWTEADEPVVAPAKVEETDGDAVITH